MKFVVMPDALKSAFAAVRTVVPRKPSLPVLECVLFKPSEDGQSLTLTGSDGDVTAVVPLSVEEAEDLRPFLMDAAYLQNVIGNLGEWPVDVEVSDKGEIIITDILGEFKTFSSYKAEEYPKVKAMNNAFEITVGASEFLASCLLASSFVSDDDLRPVMKSVALDFRKDGLRVVASDSKTLFMNIIHSASVESDVLIKVDRLLIKAASAMFAHGEDDAVTIIANDDAICIKQSDAVLTGVQMEGKFPRYEQVIPKNNNGVVSFDINKLYKAITRVRFVNESMKIMLDGQSKMTLEVLDIELSNASKVTIETNSQENITAGWSSGFRAPLLTRILDIFKGSKDAVLLLGEESRAALIKSEKDGDMTALIMPCKVDVV